MNSNKNYYFLNIISLSYFISRNITLIVINFKKFEQFEDQVIDIFKNNIENLQ